MTIIEKVNLLVGPAAASKQDLLLLLVEMAMDFAEDYCNLLRYDEKLDNIVAEMAVERFNKIGNEGIASSSASDISEAYLQDYSPSVIKKLNKHRKVKLV